MQITKSELKKEKESKENNTAVATHSSGSGKQLEVPGTRAPSVLLSKDLAVSLMNLIEKVNEGGVTPETVNASCNAAAQIYKILRLNFEMKKEGF